MTVQLDWPPEIVEQLSAEARRHGLSLDNYLLQAVLDRNATRPGSGSDAQERREAAGRNILELRKGNTLGPGFTARDLIEEGRRF